VSGRCLALSHSPVMIRRTCVARHAARFVLASWDWPRLDVRRWCKLSKRVKLIAKQSWTCSRRSVAHFGAPDVCARLAAGDEIDFAASLCVHPAGAVVAVTGSYQEGAIRETFRALHPREMAGRHARAFEFLEVVGEEDAPDEYLDLAGFGKGAGA
jgi:hypothetical protein